MGFILFVSGLLAFWLACLLAYLAASLPSFPSFHPLSWLVCVWLAGLLACWLAGLLACSLALWLAMEIELKNPAEIENKNRKIGYPMLLPSAAPESPLNEQPESTLNKLLN